MNKPKLIDLGHSVAKLEETKHNIILTIMTPGCVDEHFPYDPPQSIQLFQSAGKSNLKDFAEAILEYLKTEDLHNESAPHIGKVKERI